MKKMVIGIDQSYTDSGISIATDGELRKISDLKAKSSWSKTEYRMAMHRLIDRILDKNIGKANETIIIFERIRIASEGFVSMPYIKAMAALDAVIVDVAYKYNVKCYSVDTRAWKSAVIGTSKPSNNKFGIDPKKWPTIQWMIGRGHEQDLLLEVSNKKKKGVVLEANGRKYTYNDNKADSAAIALYGFLPKSQQKLVEEY